MEIIGTIIKHGKTRPFVFDTDTKRFQLDEYAARLEKNNLPAVNQAEMTETIRKLADFDEIRFDEYFCEVCQNWFNADKKDWSYGICLSCSLDRGTELSEIYD